MFPRVVLNIKWLLSYWNVICWWIILSLWNSWVLTVSCHCHICSVLYWTIKYLKLGTTRWRRLTAGSRHCQPGRAGRSHLGSGSGQWYSTIGAGAGAVSLSSAPVSPTPRQDRILPILRLLVTGPVCFVVTWLSYFYNYHTWVTSLFIHSNYYWI